MINLRKNHQPETELSAPCDVIASARGLVKTYGAGGVIMVGWIVGETILIQGFSWPQGLYLLTGLLVAVGSWRLPIAAKGPATVHVPAA